MSLSGGKDSTACLLKALDEYPVEMVIPVFCDTGFEHTKTYEYLWYLEDRLGVLINRIRSTIFSDIPSLIDYRGIFPSGMRRFCTDEMKMRPANKYYQTLKKVPTEHWLGMRSDESVNRRQKYGGLDPEELHDPSILGRGTPKGFSKWMRTRLPIVDWTTEDVFASLKAHNVERNPLYDDGHKRVGCFPCVLGGLEGYASAWADPEGRANIQRLFDLEDVLNDRWNEKRGPSDLERSVKIKPNYDRFRMAKVIEIKLAGRAVKTDDMEESSCAACSI